MVDSTHMTNHYYYYYYLLAVAAIVLFGAAPSLLPSSFAQQDNATQLNATGSDVPVLERISDKGIYNV
ncbi:MAG TPA: hypothetical protein VFH09_03555, partial [Nitrososphaera sp.]|nr:hypothetical protein [Nitrososphaera sp.]